MASKWAEKQAVIICKRWNTPSFPREPVEGHVPLRTTRVKQAQSAHKRIWLYLCLQRSFHWKAIKTTKSLLGKSSKLLNQFPWDHSVKQKEQFRSFMQNHVLENQSFKQHLKVASAKIIPCYAFMRGKGILCIFNMKKSIQTVSRFILTAYVYRESKTRSKTRVWCTSCH